MQIYLFQKTKKNISLQIYFQSKTQEKTHPPLPNTEFCTSCPITPVVGYAAYQLSSLPWNKSPFSLSRLCIYISVQVLYNTQQSNLASLTSNTHKRGEKMATTVLTFYLQFFKLLLNWTLKHTGIHAEGQGSINHHLTLLKVSVIRKIVTRSRKNTVPYLTFTQISYFLSDHNVFIRQLSHFY